MRLKKKNIITGVLIITALLGIGVSGTVGSEDDPLISLSYIQNVVMPYIDQAVEGASSSEFIVVELKKGESLAGKSGCEIILRSGEAVVFIPASAAGGFTDVTKGADIANGDKVEANHLLICPRSDGRKIEAKSGAFFMVRGAYEID